MNRDFQFQQAMHMYVNNHVPTWVPAFGVLLFVAFVWIMVWKGLALWHAGRNGHGLWFTIILLLNTAGILEIIYLFGVLKLTFSKLFSKD